MSSNNGTNPILVAEGGVTTPVDDDRNPFEILDDLMQVVEALCPKWPEREPIRALKIAHRSPAVLCVTADECILHSIKLRRTIHMYVQNTLI
jgi:hypothetical protein